MVTKMKGPVRGRKPAAKVAAPRVVQPKADVAKQNTDTAGPGVHNSGDRVSDTVINTPLSV